MPRKRRRALAQRSRELTYEQEMELVVGPIGRSADGRERSAFADPIERREMWNLHRDRLLDYTPAGQRPWGWWAHDAPEPRPLIETKFVDWSWGPDRGRTVTMREPEPQESYLRRVGCLSDDEARQLDAWARAAA
jgi:hypothetical protein